MNAIRDGIVNTGRRTLLATGAVVLLAALTVPSAGAQSVEAIKKAGVLKAGVQVAQVPWGFTDASGKLTGYDVEFIEMVAKDLGVKPEFVPVTPARAKDGDWMTRRQSGRRRKTSTMATETFGSSG